MLYARKRLRGVCRRTGTKPIWRPPVSIEALGRYADQPVETGDASGLYHVGIDCAGRLLHILRIISCAALASSGVRGRLGAEPIGPTMTLFNN